jgi:hypothetical protein
MKQEDGLFVYYVNVDYQMIDSALTLKTEELKTHEDGWTISGKIHEDYYEWVNEFEASHPILGKVWGDFEEKVYAEKEEGFKDFYDKHTPEDWDYGDI